MKHEKILSVSNNELNALNTSFINEYDSTINIGEHNPYYFHLESGKEHYRLLMYASTLYDNSIIFDVGTNKCMSCLALSYNTSNMIKSFDVVKLFEENPIRNNVEYIIGDSTLHPDLPKVSLIFLDVDHDGTYENKFYNHLKSINWKGILLLDDIHLNDPMIEFWNNISETKYDITSIGHWSGTGMVIFE